MKEKIQTALWVVGFVLAFDFLGFALWSASGQQPMDNFYLGSITAHTLQAFNN